MKDYLDEEYPDCKYCDGTGQVPDCVLDCTIMCNECYGTGKYSRGGEQW